MITEPFNEELPSVYADRLGVQYSLQVSIKHKKDYGQFFTPLPIASLMASFCEFSKDTVKVLDPGCGTAVLSCTLIESIIIRNSQIVTIELVAYETDPELFIYAELALAYLKVWLSARNIKFRYSLLLKDFILEKSVALRDKDRIPEFDLIISNPPYFKLNKNDERVIAVKQFMSGQSNIYSIFIGIACKLLSNNGEIVFIVPRSFASGSYFRTFRELFFSTVQIEKIHLFNSRKDTFRRDKVLQETVILKAVKEKTNPSKRVLVSSSAGISDIPSSSFKHFSSSELIDLETHSKILHLPTSEKEEKILNLIASWRNVLIDYKIQISTGPVVSFRSKKHIQYSQENGTSNLAPLFWLQNVNKMVLEWPKNIPDKGQYIRIADDSKTILIPNKNYIFLRRFSTKDDKSRLIAAPYFCNYINSEFIGVENKVNYIYKIGGHLIRDEVVGICALLNSELFDIYFQIFNGNVNVSATELRGMWFPPLKDIKEIGSLIILANNYSLKHVNSIVTNYYNLKEVLE